jgi:hypothetical protein
MGRTVVGLAENVDTATPYMNEGGLRRFAGDRSVPKAYVCSHAYFKKFPNATAMLAA